MDDFDDDPLNLLDDDDDGVLDTILLLDEDEKLPVQTNTGCLGLVAFVLVPIGVIVLL